jgi:hypothetical protein
MDDVVVVGTASAVTTRSQAAPPRRENAMGNFQPMRSQGATQGTPLLLTMKSM